jgi:hypothetical protein
MVPTGSRHWVVVKTKYLFFFHAAAMLLFYIAQGITVPEVLYFPKIFYSTSLCSRVAGGTGVDPTSRVYSSAMSVLPIVGNRKIRF